MPEKRLHQRMKFCNDDVGEVRTLLGREVVGMNTYSLGLLQYCAAGPTSLRCETTTWAN